MNLLELRGVHAGYDAIEVLHGIDVAVAPGQVVACLGPNGAGKSTLMRVICGQIAPTRGDLFVAGRRMNGARPADLARAGLCTIPEGRGVFPNLTVRENLWMMSCGGTGRAQIEEVAYAYFPRLADRAGQVAGTLSGGEQQMLGLARAVATQPALLLLDELSMGLAPIVADELFTAVSELASRGVAIFIVEQFAERVLRLADHVVVISQGLVAAAGTPEFIRSELQAAYLGGPA